MRIQHTVRNGARGAFLAARLLCVAGVKLAPAFEKAFVFALDFRKARFKLGNESRVVDDEFRRLQLFGNLLLLGLVRGNYLRNVCKLFALLVGKLLAFGLWLRGDDFSVALSGGLGAGKTAFVKCLARAKGITQKVKSPSFNICCVYDIPSGGKLVHVDAYRFADGARFEDLLLDEIAPSPRILCVEWAEIVADYFKPDYWLDFDIRGNVHTIKLR